MTPLPACMPAFTTTHWTLATPHRGTLTESPLWCEQSQRFVWIDVAEKTAWRLDLAHPDVCERWPLPETPGCIAPSRSGAWVLGLRSGVWVADTWGAALRQVWAYAPNAQGLRLNDGKADKQGNFWVGSYSDLREPTASLVCLRPCDWLPIAHRDGFAASNGLAFSANRAYWANTPAHQVLTWAWNGQGSMGPAQLLCQFSPKPEGWLAQADAQHARYGGRPDGATLDAEGCYWVAMFEGSAVLRLSPKGEVLTRLQAPCLRPTMPALGGPDLTTLLLTSAQGPADSGEPATGGHVWCTTVDVPGVAVSRVDF